MRHGAAFICSRSVPASSTRSRRLTPIFRGGLSKRAWFIGAETFSRLLDWTDRRPVCSSATARRDRLEAKEGAGTKADRGVLTAQCALTAPTATALCRRRAVHDGHRRPSPDGRARGLQACGRHDHRRDRGGFEATGTTADDIDWLVPHQANPRIIDGSAKKLGIPLERLWLPSTLHGNTSAASIPLALMPPPPTADQEG